MTEARLDSFSKIINATELKDPENSILTIIDDCVKKFKDDIIKDRSRILSEFDKSNKNFINNNYKIWNTGLELLESFIIQCTELGELFNITFGEKLHNDPVYHILIRQHARACQIANEILILLKNGFPDGADARTRTLHEIATISLFILNNGKDCAQRFIDHQHIESRKIALKHAEYAQRIKSDGPTQEELDKLNRIYNSLINKYGKSFNGVYGWAIKALGFDKAKGNCNFSQIEKKVQLDHYRPYYGISSQTIHSSYKGIDYKVRLGTQSMNHDVILAGRSSSGFTLPASSTSLSLLRITLFLLQIESNLDCVIYIKILTEFEKEIGETFLEIENSLKR